MTETGQPAFDIHVYNYKSKTRVGLSGDNSFSHTVLSSQ